MLVGEITVQFQVLKPFKDKSRVRVNIRSCIVSYKRRSNEIKYKFSNKTQTLLPGCRKSVSFFIPKGCLWSHQSTRGVRAPRGEWELMLPILMLSFCVCFFFTHLLPSSICSVLSSSLVQHKGMNFCMRSNMRYLGVNNWCTWPLQYLFPKEEFVQNSSCVTKFEDRHCPSTFVLD